MLALLAVVLLSGCSSLDKPASASFASVTIYNQTNEKIQQATVSVFENNGYQTVRMPDGVVVFEKEATKGEQIAYAGFAGAEEGVPTIVRMRMNIEPQGPHASLLSCKAYAITNPGDFVNQQIFPIFDFKSKPYQQLLDNVRDNLKVAAMSQSSATP